MSMYLPPQAARGAAGHRFTDDRNERRYAALAPFGHEDHARQSRLAIAAAAEIVAVALAAGAPVILSAPRRLFLSEHPVPDGLADVRLS